PDTGNQGGNSSIATDGTYIWVMNEDQDSNPSVVSRYTVAGVFQNSLTLPLAGGTVNPTSGRGLLYENGFLYAYGGAFALGWAFQIAADLSSNSSTALTWGNNTDDAVLTPDGFLWLGTEQASVNGGLMKVAKNMSSVTSYNIGPAG